MNCPKCNEDCCRDEVDVGVGVIYGPYGCGYCGWSEAPEYDSSEGKSKASIENPEWIVNSCGNMIRKSVVRERLDFFGLNKIEID